MNLRMSLLAAVATVGMAGAAHAVQLNGNVTLTASAITQPTTVTVDQATGINFTSGVLNFQGAAIGSGTGGTINSIASFASFTTGTLFTLSDGLSFTLNAPITVTRTPATATQLATLAFGGTGTFSGDGFDPTPGIFTVTTQGTQAVVNLASGSGIAQPTPEPASLALLGGSLAALGLIRRRR